MERIERAVHWIRGNAGVLALIVALLTLIGGIVGGIVGVDRYFSELATKDDITTAVNQAVGPLKDTVDRLDETVGDLRVTVGRLAGTVDTLSGILDNLPSTVQGPDGSVGTSDSRLPLLQVSCFSSLVARDREMDGGGVDTSWDDHLTLPGGSLDGLPLVCREWMNLQAASGR